MASGKSICRVTTVAIMAWPRVGGMRGIEMGTPGAFREELNRLILSGVKTTTTGVLALDYEDEGEVLEEPGERLALIGNDGELAGVLEVIAAEAKRLDEVSLAHAVGEGEGWETVEDWKRDHVDYWKRVSGLDVDESTLVVCVEFRSVTHDAD